MNTRKPANTDVPTPDPALRRRVSLALVALVLAWLAVWSSGVGVAFLFDDIPDIVNNGSVHDVASLEWLTHGRRPVTNLTFALNWSATGDDTTPFHALNALIHLFTAFAIFAFVLLTARTERVPERWRLRGPLLAGLISLIWLVHPLHTQSVTYIVQRAESLAGMWYMLTLLTAALGIRREDEGRSGGTWFTLAVVACALGMGSKAVTVTAPIAVLLWDAVFAGGTVGRAISRRWTLYAGLALTWAVVVFLGVLPQVLSSEPGRTVGIGYQDATWWSYLLTQAHVIWHYIALSVWPDTLVLDYDWPISRNVSGAIIPGGLLAIAFIAGLYGAWRRRWWGFAAVMFFLILAPTSSVVPTADAAAEHRMYLPLLPLLTLLVVGLVALNDRLTGGRPLRVAVPVLLIASTFLAMRTIERNNTYEDPLEMWRQVTIERPNNPRAWNNLGELRMRDEPDAAVDPLERAIEIEPGFTLAHINLTSALIESGALTRAREALDSAFQQAGDHPALRVNRGRLRLRQGDADGAAESFRRALEIDPQSSSAREKLESISGLLELRRRAESLHESGDIDAADDAYRQYINEASGDTEAMLQYAEMLIASNRDPRRALGLVERVIELVPGNTRAVILHHRASALIQGEAVITEDEEVGEFSPQNSQRWYTIGMRNIEEERPDEAEEAFRNAITFDPTNTSARYRLGVLLQRRGFHDEAAIEYEDLLVLQPDRASVLSNLGQCYYQLGRVEIAESALRKAVEADPDHHRSRLNLAILLEETERVEEAIQWYERVLEIAPGHDTAERQLRALRAILLQRDQQRFLETDPSSP